MRHRKTKVTLGRKTAPRKALFKQLASSLILHGKVTTTTSKAKALRPIIERLITKAQGDNKVTILRTLAKSLTLTAAKKLYTDIAPKYKERKGGYTRIMKSTIRKGDAAETSVIEFV